MQSHEPAQPLTFYDKLSVVLYRAGIVVVAILVVAGGLAMTFSFDKVTWKDLSLKDGPVLLFYFLSLYLFTGISVGTIHLYAKRFRKLVRILYLSAFAGGVVLYVMSGGSPIGFFLKSPIGPVLVLPLAGTVGFIAMKEAFCFKLVEGYLLAILLPTVVLLMMLRTFSPALIGAMFVFAGLLLGYLAWHKVRMPLGYDIGDKSLYEK
jgi:uncharacterized integral membrane protein